MKKELWEWTKSFGFAILFVVAIRTFFIAPTLVDGASMHPTYEDEDIVVINKIGTTLAGIERFDVIVFQSPLGPDYIKRVIGLPGDEVAYVEDVLYINGEPFEEPYLQGNKAQLLDNRPLTPDFTLADVTNAVTVPEAHYFVLGDNRRLSSDSRDNRVGFVPFDDVRGKVNWRVYPFDAFGTVEKE